MVFWICWGFFHECKNPGINLWFWVWNLMGLLFAGKLVSQWYMLRLQVCVLFWLFGPCSCSYFRHELPLLLSCYFSFFHIIKKILFDSGSFTRSRSVALLGIPST